MLFPGDCFEVLPTLGDNFVELVLVDLPYNQTKCDWECEIDLEKMWKELKRICKKNANIVFFTTARFGYKLIQSQPDYFRYDLVWSKPSSNAGFQTANRLPMRRHELIYVFANPLGNKKIYNPQMTEGTPYSRGVYKCDTNTYGKLGAVATDNKGTRHPSSIIERNLTGEKRYHPCQKPVSLCSWLIKTYSNEGDVVLDFCCGSGSTGVAAKLEKRNFIGIEKNNEYFMIAAERINGTE
jgi:site-specific DNA-methyltransferase (adenine-specific)